MTEIGHWKNITEAQKLTESVLIPGVIEEDIYLGHPLDFGCPIVQAQGKSIKWNREEIVLEAEEFDIGQELVWDADMEYDQQEVSLKRIYKQRRLDQFNIDVHGTINNYEEIAMMEMNKGCIRTLGDRFFYGDNTYGGSKQFDGIHAYAAIQTGTSLDIDEGEGALSIHNLRLMIRAMKYGVDGILMPPCIFDRFAEAYEERGISALATYGARTTITRTADEIGTPIYRFNGIPLWPCDFLVGENANTGEGSDARAKHSTGTAQYSIFGIKWGDVTLQQPGLSLGFGATDMVGDFYRVQYFDKLENYDGPGIRLVNYSAPLLGSKLCLGRIFDVTDDAITE